MHIQGKDKKIFTIVALLICFGLQFCAHAYPLFYYEFKSENLFSQGKTSQVNKNTDSTCFLKNILSRVILNPYEISRLSSVTTYSLGYFYSMFLKPASFNHSPPHLA